MRRPSRSATAARGWCGRTRRPSSRERSTRAAGSTGATAGERRGRAAEGWSHGVLAFTGFVDLTAPKGTSGTLLLDPQNVIICKNCGEDDDGTSKIQVGTLEKELGQPNGKVIVTTGTSGSGEGNIVVNAPVTWDTNSSLTLSAYGNVILHDSLTSTGGGAIILRADNTGTGIGTVTFNGHFAGEDEFVQAHVSTSGQVSIFYNPGSYDGENKSTVTGGNPYSKFMEGDGKLTAYMLVNNVTDLQNIGKNLSGVYALGRDIDATGVNFTPIGSLKGPGFAQFTGIFDGQSFNGSGPTISNLTIASVDPNITSIGLFGVNSGTIQNLQLTNVSITANPKVAGPGQFVGTLVGQNFGLISNVSASGQIDGKNLAGMIAGGLVGQN